jgi:hypothetical protein
MFSFLVVILLIAASISSAQNMKETKSCCNKEMKEMDKDSNHTMDMDSTKSGHMHMSMTDHKNMMEDSSVTMKESLVREGEIDLNAIDQNKDGMVYQDQMDWNVISDKTGECPLCGMKLKEVSLNEAKENLLKHDFKVK